MPLIPLTIEHHVARGDTESGAITLTTTDETSLVAASGDAVIFHDLVLLVVSNTSATKTRVDIRDSLGGTVRWSFALAADGGGAVIQFPVPLEQTTANQAWTAQIADAVTDVRVNALMIKRRAEP